MKKSVVIPTLVLLLLVGSGYLVINGTPWGKARIERDAAAYLQEKYAWESIVDQGHYSLDGGYYWASEHRKDDSQSFQVIGPRGGRSELQDDYVMAHWEEEPVAELRPFLKKVFSPEVRVIVSIKTDYKTDDAPHPIPDVPTLRQIRDKVSDLYLFIDPGRLYDSNRDEQERQSLFDLYQQIVKQGYRPDMVNVCFCDYSAKKENNTSFIMRYSQMEQLKSKDDIKPTIE